MNNEEKLVEVRDIGWVADDGSYGVGNVILFQPNALTLEQWDSIDNVPDVYKLSHINTMLEGE